MARSTSKDAQALFQSLCSAYAATPTTLKIIDLYVIYAVFTALIQVAYMAIVGSFPFNSFLSGVLSCIGTAVLAGFGTRASFCRFRPVQLGSPFGDYQLPWLKYLILGSTSFLVSFGEFISAQEIAYARNSPSNLAF
ncbi:dolichyl-diphosphooligosaccharide--protein glycosyltransferase subunit DAD1 [Cucumis melo var. makuwa]|uniref:Dolichyl-diphosphooligosaccharide--protein glycosyltransferase subunit DAD1 n=1 Tax=Cucumis melo var. makuwa TaxID=1194695 RepID=A0A5A7UES7_CUCMM|nr:dolichyl-diphosphooligosaccharide--protein glycosyltransferase subunit DAD1 [Cucumis melo var. makuwa]TYK11473.1 dolichyl-diphosphooligosaccharide--protein glycosyltransferase subunit DAD1 [Cucumis melo var. makuwa]